MDAAHADGVKKQVKVYITVFVALMGLTLITVTISSFHLGVGAAIAVALLIATIKATLVAGYFMHLLSEKKVIYATLLLVLVFFLALMFLPVFHSLDKIVQ